MLKMANMCREPARTFEKVPPRSMPITNHHSMDEVMGYQPWPHSPLGVVYWPIRTPRRLPNISADFRRHGGGHSEVGGKIGEVSRFSGVRTGFAEDG